MTSSAYVDGWLAHKNMIEQSKNPYDEKTQTRSNSEWLNGWCARFDAIKHNKSLDLDENWWSSNQ